MSENNVEAIKPKDAGAKSVAIWLLLTVTVAVAYFLSIWLPFRSDKPLSRLFAFEANVGDAFFLVSILVFFAVCPFVMAYFTVLGMLVRRSKNNFSPAAESYFYLFNLGWWILGTIAYGLMNLQPSPNYKHEIILAMVIAVPFGVAVMGVLGAGINWLAFRLLRPAKTEKS